MTVKALPCLWADASSGLHAELAGPDWLRWLLWLALFFGLFPLIVAYLVWAERKVAARFQDRIGPNRVGPLGLLQPIADALKLILKEDLVPRSADRWVHLLAPVLLMISAFLVLAVIPFGVTSTHRILIPFGETALDPSRLWYPTLAAMDTSSGLLYLVAASSLSVLGIFLAGWASRNKFSLLGAMRGVAQLVSYEIPQILSLIPVILWSGTLSLTGMFTAQVDQGWFLFSPPGILAFIILTIASVAETNRSPFDLPEADSEIIAGYHTEYSGMRFGLFFLAEYLSIFGIACLTTALFLGGGTLPGLRFPLDSNLHPIAANAILLSVFALKVGLYIFVVFWLRATLPRMRVDRLMNFSWKVLTPLSLVNVLVASLWLELTIRRPSLSNLAIAWLICTLLLVGSVWIFLRLTRDQPAPRTARLELGPWEPSVRTSRP